MATWKTCLYIRGINQLTCFTRRQTLILYDCSKNQQSHIFLSRLLSTQTGHQPSRHGTLDKALHNVSTSTRNRCLKLNMPFNACHHHTLPSNMKCLHGHPLLSTNINQSKRLEKTNFTLSTKSILESSPPSIQPYLRLIRFDKPIGTFLLYWPCTWSIGLAAQAGHLPSISTLAWFGIGAFLMRGAGCIINDMWDKDFDKKVARTKTRPLASGELTPFQALVFLGSQLSLALAVLLQFNTYSVILGAASMGLVICYPLAKRYTYWPQVLLGLSLNWGVLLAWSVLNGALDWRVAPLYCACVLYTVFYDTIYSHQDKYDDMLIGVKSTALKLGDNTKPWLVGFSTITIGGLSLSGFLCDQTWPFYLGVSAMTAHLAHQIITVDLNNPDSCASKFRSNNQLGLLVFIGIVLGTLLKSDKTTEEKKRDVGINS
ncbi:4-hydroxybenzoate polyprenyltransferase, mitochondrial isoform X2 [Patella vulgata]|uniref:4-hydroxybenzoate polyprenyltransferase, mitochondrial isoform X2 n=1 Tax=Patella vulgata TaxID=6465 RepID=UPI0024A86A03|nr:4-hydroxybenzoate polyprenyltransferase, mitochondrial isoform X2 [Patella vulgata]